MSTSTRFSESFWGEDGWAALTKKLTESRIALEEFGALALARSKLEQDYAQRLAQLSATKKNGDGEMGDVKGAMRRYLTQMGTEAEEHSRLGSYLHDQVHGALHSLHEEQRRTRHDLKKEVQSMQKRYNDAVKMCLDRQTKYNRLAGELEGLGLTYQRLAAVTDYPVASLRKDLDKMKAKIMKIDGEVTMAKNAYQQAVVVAEKERESFEHDYSLALDQCEHMERERIEKTQSIFCGLLNAQVSASALISNTLGEVADMFRDTISVDRDIDAIATERGTNSIRPTQLYFEEYASKFGGLGDGSGNGGGGGGDSKRGRGMTLPSWFKRSSAGAQQPYSGDTAASNVNEPPIPPHSAPPPPIAITTTAAADQYQQPHDSISVGAAGAGDYVAVTGAGDEGEGEGGTRSRALTARQMVPEISGQMSKVRIDGEHEHRCRAIYEYVAQDETELSFNAGDMIIIVERGSMGWWFGRMPGSQVVGTFPANFVEDYDKNRGDM